eukprot:5662770-Prymnesium_polylepis.1
MDAASAFAKRDEDEILSRKGLDMYGWGQFRGWNDMARLVAAAHGVPFLDVFPATRLRPGGHRVDRRFHRPPYRHGKVDCAHYCTPGPINDWVASLLALWTLPRKAPGTKDVAE